MTPLQRLQTLHDLDTVLETKRLTMNAGLWHWVETTAAGLHLDHHHFIATLLEWARNEGVLDDMDLVKPHLKTKSG